MLCGRGRRTLSLEARGSNTRTISAETFPHVKLEMYKGMRRVTIFEEEKVYHATLTLECCKTEGPATFRQLVDVMLYAFRGKSPIFYDTVRVQDTVFESGKERLTVVGHRVRFWAALWSEERLIGCLSLNAPRHIVIIFPSRFAISACSCALDKSHGAIHGV